MSDIVVHLERYFSHDYLHGIHAHIYIYTSLCSNDMKASVDVTLTCALLHPLPGPEQREALSAARGSTRTGPTEAHPLQLGLPEPPMEASWAGSTTATTELCQVLHGPCLPQALLRLPLPPPDPQDSALTASVGDDAAIRPPAQGCSRPHCSHAPHSRATHPTFHFLAARAALGSRMEKVGLLPAAPSAAASSAQKLPAPAAAMGSPPESAPTPPAKAP